MSRSRAVIFGLKMREYLGNHGSLTVNTFYRSAVEAPRVAGVVAQRSPEIQSRGHTVAPARLQRHQRGGLLRGTSHHWPSSDV